LRPPKRRISLPGKPGKGKRFSLAPQKSVYFKMWSLESKRAFKKSSL